MSRRCTERPWARVRAAWRCGRRGCRAPGPGALDQCGRLAELCAVPEQVRDDRARSGRHERLLEDKVSRQQVECGLSQTSVLSCEVLGAAVICSKTQNRLAQAVHELEGSRLPRRQHCVALGLELGRCSPGARAPRSWPEALRWPLSRSAGDQGRASWRRAPGARSALLPTSSCRLAPASFPRE